MNLKEELNHRIFDIVKNASEKLGYESFVVGGWVRDLLLNNKNKKDKIIKDVKNWQKNNQEKVKDYKSKYYFKNK